MEPQYTKADDYYIDAVLRACEPECCMEAGVELSDGLADAAAMQLADAIMRDYAEEDERTACIEAENKQLKHDLTVSHSLACIGWIACLVCFVWALSLWMEKVAG